MALSANDLELMANELPFSQFDGGNTGMALYSGQGDNFLNFRGRPNGSFYREYDQDNSYELTFTNTNPLKVDVYLNLSFAGDQPGVNGFISDGVIDTLTFDAQVPPEPYQVTVEGSPEKGSVENWLWYHKEKPINFLSFRMWSNKTEQNQLSMVWEPVDAYEANSNSNSLKFSNFVDPNQYHQELIDIPVHRQIDNEHRIRFSIAGGTTTEPSKVRLTLFLGASLNPVKALRDKTLLGRATAIKMSGQKSWDSSSNQKGTA